MIDSHHGWNTRFKPLIIGFLSSLVFTCVSYYALYIKSLSQSVILFILLGATFLSLLSQLIFFMHLGKESKPRWNLTLFLFMLLVTFLIIGGSLWIMENLNRYMTPMGN